MSRQAGIYLRISFDPNATRLGVSRQLMDCETKAKQRGWVVAEVFEDNDTSASTGRRRPAYESMLTALAEGRINAVVVWDLDRLTRRPIEIEQFIELADRHQVELASVGGDIDLSTDNGRLYARIKGAVARAEIERKTARQKAANKQRREMGKPHACRRGFGYTTDGMSIVPEEAEAIRSAAADLLAGASVHAIARSLNAQGFTTTVGNAWKPTEARRMLARPRLAALASYRGEVTGEGSWPPILDPDTHRAIRGVLADPSRHAAGRPRAYLLSGIATCGLCEERLYCGWDGRKSYPIYRCSSGAHISRRGSQIDDLVTDVVLTRLEDPAAIHLFTRPAEANLAHDLRKDERMLRDRLNGLAEAFAAGEIDRGQMTAGSARLNSRLVGISARLNATLQQPALSELISTADIRASWEALSMERRRRVLRSLLDSVSVHSAGQGARRFDPSTVEISWRSA